MDWRSRAYACMCRMFSSHLTRIHINTQRFSHARIYHDVDRVLNKIVDRLKSPNSIFEDAYLVQTGSILSNTKVGLPHEADYLLVLRRPNIVIKVGQIYSIMKETISNNLFFHETLPLQYNGMKRHGTTGICLFLQYVSYDGTVVGVSVDVTPVYNVKPGDWVASNIQMRDKAMDCFGQTWDELVQSGDIYTLIERNQVDTGIVENKIMNGLPESYRQAFRVAKFLLQSRVTSEPVVWSDWALNWELSDLRIRDFESFLELYGLKCCVPSYRLRVCFLNLYVQTRGTLESTKLDGGLLTLCLLHMIAYLGNFGIRYIDHPLLDRLEPVNKSIIFKYHPNIHSQMFDTVRKFEEMSPELQTLPLLNYPQTKLTQTPGSIYRWVNVSPFRIVNESCQIM